MEQTTINTPLNKHQLEILKLFSRDMEEEDFLEIKRLIVRYLAEKVSDEADKVWEKNNWTNEDMNELLKKHHRTRYNYKNHSF